MAGVRGAFDAGIVGTFDVENFGDLLFPLIADAALRQRDPRIRVHAYSIHAKSAADWPYAVGSVADLSDALPQLAALLVGGGQIVRFDRRYPVPIPAGVEAPFAYWLTPAAQAAQLGKPVVWNAVGVSLGWPRTAWHEELIRAVLSASVFIGVRDRRSQAALAALAPAASIQLLPDTAFGAARLWPLGDESRAFTAWRSELGLSGRYLVMQATEAVATHHLEIEALAAAMGVAIVLVPICPCHGDRVTDMPASPTRILATHGWPPPALLCEILGRAEFVVASSLHACITALSYGVPVARVRIYWGPSKYDLLDAFTGVADLADTGAMARLVARGRHVESLAQQHADALDAYWDDVCHTVLQPAAVQCEHARRTMLDWTARATGGRGRPGAVYFAGAWLRDRLSRYLVEERMVLRRWLSTIASWRHAVVGRAATPPVGSRQARARTQPPIFDTAHLAGQTMATVPFTWAFIDRLYSPDAGAALAATFPRDRFRTVKGHDGEKDYEYVSRSLVHMGAADPSHPEGLSRAWQALAEDLLSPEYRAAISRLTGVDLSTAPMEVNVLHYGPGAWLGPHLDLKAKVVTHVLYFNDRWDPAWGGCLNILTSSDPNDVHATIPPVVGNSVLLVRSNQSWHSVSRVAAQCTTSRRSVNVIFHLPGAVSTMWPPGKTPDLHDLEPAATQA